MWSHSRDIPDTPEDIRCESRLYGVAIDEVDSPPEEIFEEELEVHVGVKGTAPFLELDENIDIALFMLVAPGERPEYCLTPGLLIRSRCCASVPRMPSAVSMMYRTPVTRPSG